MPDYYSNVERYYDSDAGDFDKRYWKNPVLQQIRQSFREEVYAYPFTAMLEVGYGTGLDMAHFAMNFPEAKVFGVDISGEMQGIASQRFEALGLPNAQAEQGSVEQIAERFPGQRFDMIYVFFGALNTVEDLGKAAELLRQVLSPGGRMVLTFVNKWYVGGMLIELMKLRFKAAFARLRKVWGGYSPTVFLPSRCYAPADIRRAFSGMRIVRRRGYSILHPAWYYHGINDRMPRRLGQALWRTDDLLNRTFFWRFGEYALYVIESGKDIAQDELR